MAITIIHRPTPLLLTEAPVVFDIQSDYNQGLFRLQARVTTLPLDSAAPDPSGFARFELSDYLKGLVTMRYKMENTATRYWNNPFPVSFDFHEFYGSPPAQHGSIADGLYYVLDGKIPASQRQKLYSQYPSLLDYLVNHKNCLTWWPLSEYKKVSPDQREFINYLQVQSQQEVTLRINVSVLYTDGTSDALPMPYPEVGYVWYMTAVYFPVGYNQLGIQAFVDDFAPGKTVHSYYVSVFCQAINYSQVYKFEVDHSYVENPRYLWIRNPFGFLEVLRTSGKSEQLSELKSEVAQTDGVSQPDKVSWSVSRTDSIKVNTGWLTPLQVQWLADLLESVEAYELIGNALQPIVFRDIRIPVVHDGEYQYSADIEYEYAYSSPIISAP